MNPVTRTRLWKVAFSGTFLVATWVLLMPDAPGAPGLGAPGVDKLYHAALFALLAALASFAYADKPRWAIFASLVFYGVCIEIAQSRTGRSAEGLDIVADILGALVAFAFPKRRPTRH